jgi:hypothetical protein
VIRGPPIATLLESAIPGNVAAVPADPDPIRNLEETPMGRRKKTGAKTASATDPARLAMLARVDRGELDHSAAAKELGSNVLVESTARRRG